MVRTNYWEKSQLVISFQGNAPHATLLMEMLHAKKRP